ARSTGPRSVRRVKRKFTFSPVGIGILVPASHPIPSGRQNSRQSGSRSHSSRVKTHLDLDDVRRALKPFYSSTGRPSIDPELMIRMLIVGYCMGIRSERCLCEDVHLNLGYRWFCRLGLDGKVPDHSTFSKKPARALEREQRLASSV